MTQREATEIELKNYDWQTEGYAPAQALLAVLADHRMVLLEPDEWNPWGMEICLACRSAWNEETGCPMWQLAWKTLRSHDPVYGCWCRTCDQRRAEGTYRGTGDFSVLTQRRFIVCPECGNKRCNQAQWHGWTCTHSNDVKQPAPEPRDDDGTI